MTDVFQFPKNFIWGSATCAYQIEGAAREGGKGESIWDVFTRIPGKIFNGDNGDTACNHYHLWKEDIQLMRAIGLKTYRLSLAWPRILPRGFGKVNQQGVDFYDRVIDELLQNDITPLVTLYHWDLPSALVGGWLERSVVDAFIEYTDVAVNAYGDRVKTWFTINEPYVASHLGYSFGIHAPGMADMGKGLIAAHHLLLSHGMATAAIKEIDPNAEVGIVLNLSPMHGDSDHPARDSALRHHDGELNRWFLDPIFGKDYPEDMLEDFCKSGILKSPEPDFIKEGDLDAIAVRTDVLGINYYSRTVLEAPEQDPDGSSAERKHHFAAEVMTDMGWEVYPRGLYEILTRVNTDYAPRKIMITENGASYGDEPGPDGRVHDDRRIAYLKEHILSVWQAIQTGVPVSGYLVWSLMDNFEWSYGYSQRFGIIHVDYEDQKRTIKDSAYWFGNVIQENAVRA